jgi:ubiquinone/menaquinone biosynthesis C-methylase UbiE
VPQTPPEPTPTDNELAKAAITESFDRSAATYEETGVAFFAPLGAELVARAAPKPGESVLDLGCGRGHCLFPAAEAVGPSGRVVGTDLSPLMVELCAADAAARGLAHVRVELGDAGEPAFPAASFDLVTAGLVMFFVLEPRPAMRRVAEVLRPGGRFAMTTFGPPDPKFAETMTILFSHRVGPPWAVSEDKPFEDAESITAMLTDAGFVDVRVEEVARDTWFADVEQYWAWLGSHGGRILIDQLTPDQFAAARAEADAALAPHLEPDGRLVTRSLIRFTTAAVPGGRG